MIMTLSFLLDYLQELHGISIKGIFIHKGKGRSSYDWATDAITIFRGGRTEKEQVFSALHEFRHAIQVRENLFPEIFTLTYDAIPSTEKYFELPWEKDANEWALEMGRKFGFFDAEFKPSWLP